MNRNTKRPLTLTTLKDSMDLNTTNNWLPNDYFLKSLNFQNPLIFKYTKLGVSLVRCHLTNYFVILHVSLIFTLFFILLIKLLAKNETILLTFGLPE